MPDIDPWLEGFSQVASTKLLLGEALQLREVAKVASLIGATDAIAELAVVADPKGFHDGAAAESLTAVEDAVTARLVEALGRDPDYGGVLCAKWGVECMPRVHTVLAVMFMAWFLRQVVEVWRPAIVPQYESMIKLGHEAIGEIRKESGR
jgi:hypothetical protein